MNPEPEGIGLFGPQNDYTYDNMGRMKTADTLVSGTGDGIDVEEIADRMTRSCTMSLAEWSPA